MNAWIPVFQYQWLLSLTQIRFVHYTLQTVRVLVDEEVPGSPSESFAQSIGLIAEAR